MLPASMNDEIVREVIRERREQACGHKVPRGNAPVGGWSPRQRLGAWMIRIGTALDGERRLVAGTKTAHEPTMVR